MAIPVKNSLLVDWSTTFNDLFGSSPTTYGGTAAQATQYGTLHTAWIASYTAANASNQKNKALCAAMYTAKAALLPYARMLYKQIQANVAIAPNLKVELGIHVPDTSPSSIPAPVLAPALETVSVFGRNVRVGVRHPVTGKRTKPAGCVGVSLFSFVSPTLPPADATWQSEGNVTRSDVIVQFPETIAPTTVVWFTAFYYTARGLAGPACTPIQARIGYEGAEPLAA
jgi:hypothetical protein